MAADRTILTPAAFPIAHLKAYAPKFSGNMWKMPSVWKLGVPAPSKVCWSSFVSLKKAVFEAFFGEKPRFDWLRPNDDPPLIYIVGKLWISAFSWYFWKHIFFILLLDRILVTLQESSHYTTSLSVIRAPVGANKRYEFYWWIWMIIWQ